MIATPPIQYVLWGVKESLGRTPKKLQIGATISQKYQDIWKREGWTCVLIEQGHPNVELKLLELQKVVARQLPACHLQTKGYGNVTDV